LRHANRQGCPKKVFLSCTTCAAALLLGLNGQCHEIFDFRFFHQFPPRP
jgi:hypothetical protein